MYRFDIDLSENTLTFVKIDLENTKDNTKKKNKPICSRHNHLMISLSSNYIGFLGGKTFKKIKKMN